MKPTQDHPYPRVGIGTFIIKEGRFLIGLRQGAHGANTWGLPGGKLELGESWQDCSLREIAEEVGLTVNSPAYHAITNDIFDEGLHYITIFMTADWIAGEPRILEPTKCSEWRWCTPTDLPDNSMLPLKHLAQQSGLPF